MTSEVIISLVFSCHNKNSIKVKAYLNLDFIFTSLFTYVNKTQLFQIKNHSCQASSIANTHK
jgi:hypothetical protein